MAVTAQRYEIKSLEKPDEVRTFDKGRVELFHVGDKTIGRFTFQPGWKWSESVKPMAGTDTCQVAHLGYQLSGTMHVRCDDSQEFEIKPGDSFSLAAGHDAWVVGEEPVVVLDIQGSEDYGKPGSGKAGARREGRKH